MNKQQRNEVYRIVYDMLLGTTIGSLTKDRKDWCLNKSGLCELLYIAPQTEWDGYFCPEAIGGKPIIKIFPEFARFQPDEVDCPDGVFWWEQSNREARMNAIAFCIVLTD